MTEAQGRGKRMLERRINKKVGGESMSGLAGGVAGLVLRALVLSSLSREAFPARALHSARALCVVCL